MDQKTTQIARLEKDRIHAVLMGWKLDAKRIAGQIADLKAKS